MATAQGDVKFNGNAKRTCCLLTGVVATNGVPVLATDGITVYPDEGLFSSANGVCDAVKPAREGTLFVKAVGTAGTVTVTIRLWGYHKDLGEWVPLGTGSDSGKGVINGGASMGATKALKVLHSEPVLLVGHFDRIYAEVTAIGGTGTTVEVWLTVPRTVAY